jgi:high-affinity Fe2+/Pb2+ permease
MQLKDGIAVFSNNLPFKTTDCAKKLGGALFLVGEIGGNDYNYAFFQKRSIEAVKAYVPQVVKSIMDFTKASIISTLLPKWSRTNQQHLVLLQIHYKL